MTILWPAVLFEAASRRPPLCGRTTAHLHLKSLDGRYYGQSVSQELNKKAQKRNPRIPGRASVALLGTRKSLRDILC